MSGYRWPALGGLPVFLFHPTRLEEFLNQKMNIMNIATTKDVLNDLIKINNDRIAGYETALEDTSLLDADLKVIFESKRDNSLENKKELTDLMMTLSRVENNTDESLKGMLHRTWLDMKATFSGDTREALLESCEFGEDAILKVYNEAIEKFTELPSDVSNTIMEQKAKLQKDHDQIKKYRDAYKAAKEVVS